MKKDYMLKYQHLQNILNKMGNVVVAYSGGVDSSFLLKVAVDCLGDKCLALLAVSPSFPTREYDSAVKFAKDLGAHLEIIHTHELDNTAYTANPENRCYFCKSELFSKIEQIAATSKYQNIVDGSNADDLLDHRPGLKALREKGVRSPLQEAGLTKSDIRELSRILNLPTWDKDALACLSSRFPYGEKIDPQKLKMVDMAENFLSLQGFRNIRARHSGKTIRIEVDPKSIPLFLEEQMRIKVVEYLKSIGYQYVTLDLEGYRRGSMNQDLSTAKNTLTVKS